MRFKSLFSSAFVIVLLGASIPALYGQDPDKSQDRRSPAPQAPSTQSPSDRSSSRGEETITGCLNKGASQNEFVFTDQASGAEMNVTGSSELAAHASNHTVKLTGTKTTEGGKSEFKANKVEMVAATCSPKKG
jgi:hypothetical protein